MWGEAEHCCFARKPLRSGYFLSGEEDADAAAGAAVAGAAAGALSLVGFESVLDLESPLDVLLLSLEDLGLALP